MRFHVIVMLSLLIGLHVLTGCKHEYDVKVEKAEVRYTVLEQGTGRPVREGDLITIEYTAELPDGTVVLTDEEFTFKAGTGTVIAGIDKTVIGMRRGEARLLDCPPRLHWGRNGYGDVIPKNTRLIIFIRLDQIV